MLIYKGLEGRPEGFLDCIIANDYAQQ